jgi:hypothetical protein
MSTIRRGRSIAAAIVSVALVAGIAGCNTRYGATLDRPDDPVVLTGSSLPKLLGTAPRHVVGFSWDGSAWHQIPVQVDERDFVSPGVSYHLPTGSYPKLYGTSTLFKPLVYTPPPASTADYTSYPTYTPPDSDPNLDANDEVSFMAYDTGKQADAGAGTPIGVSGSTRQAVTAVDPLDPTHVGYVYLFHSDTLTGGSAGTTGVDYSFALTSGDYLTTYKMGTGSLAPNNTWGFNPETSTVTTPGYTQNLSDRWLNDGLSIHRGGSSGADLLDRSMYFATNAGCARTENTFDGADTGEGAFIVNISGPVRAIRSYYGANSFKWTAVSDVFYAQREDTTIELRGHAGLPGFGQADDLTTGITGMTYTDPANTALPIDGHPDAFTPITSTSSAATQPASWQLISGPGGSMVTTRLLSTTITNLNLTSTYVDQSPASTTPCTGDASSWGKSGFETNSAVSNVPVTDPTLSASPDSFTSRRYRYFEGPSTDATTAAQLDARAKQPITTTVSS